MTRDPGTAFPDVVEYYERKLREFGPTARGVDWNGPESQRLRFVQLLKVLEGWSGAEAPTVLDVGCGYGALAGFLRERGIAATYVGYDASPAMLDVARQVYGSHEGVTFTADWPGISAADVAVASGLFNVRLQHGDEAWQEYVLDTLRAIHAKTRLGWGANFLTIYSDRERMRADLYYADPRFLFDWCKRNLARDVALLHDYPLYEFTLIVRRVARGSP